jgi:hypothetical protein
LKVLTLSGERFIIFQRDPAMHVLGKVLLWLWVVLSLLAIYETSLVLGHRYRWLSEVEKRQQKVEANLVQLQETARRVRLLEEKHQSLVQDWGDVWTAPGSRVQPGGSGAIELGVGPSAGLPQKKDNGPPPQVYVFAELAGGKSQYLGEFAITDTRPNQAVATLTRKPYPDEVAGWPQGGTFHVRNLIPQNWLAVHSELIGSQALANSGLETQKLQLGILKQQIKSSQSSLDARLAELDGNPEAAAEGGSQEVTDGLVVTLRKFDSQRNVKQGEVQSLRFDVAQTYSHLRKTLEQNRVRVNRNVVQAVLQ